MSNVLRDGIRDAYSGSASAWATAPARLYRRMADALVASCPVPLEGTRVLDFGAGTGATSAAILPTGALVIAADLSPDMLAVDRATRPPAVAADAYALPVREGSFDLAMGAFVLSHLPDPVRGLREVARCVRPDGLVTTLGFDGRWRFAAKEAVESTLAVFGFRRPEWYEEFKTEVEPRTALPNRLLAAAITAGLADVTVEELAVDVDVRTPEAIVEWRLATPSFTPFVASLDAAARRELLAAACEAIGPSPEPLVPRLLVMRGRVAR